MADEKRFENLEDALNQIFALLQEIKENTAKDEDNNNDDK